MAIPREVSTLFYWQFGSGCTPTVIVLAGGHESEIGAQVQFGMLDSGIACKMTVVREVRLQDLKTAMRAYIAIFAGVQHSMLLALKGYLDMLLKEEAAISDEDERRLHAYLLEPVLEKV